MVTLYSNEEAIRALVTIFGDNKWEVAALANGYTAFKNGKDLKSAAKIAHKMGNLKIKDCSEKIEKAFNGSFLEQLPVRKNIGSAENPITKLIPATISEERFLKLIENIIKKRPSITYSDERESKHTLSDFTLFEGKYELPINIKNAGTRFEKAAELVGLNPDDCIPIPAYKAHAALDKKSNLIYAITIDYELIHKINELIPHLFDEDELIVWNLLNIYDGHNVRKAEDYFIFSRVRKYWDHFLNIARDTPFNFISAKKAIRILQTKPHRTPGIGLRAWGTKARAEVNVHISVSEETISWDILSQKILENGLEGIIKDVNKTKQELVSDPEI